ncbi:rhodanese-like domain-containing protein [Pontibacter ruber]|uniref:Rhodanese-like domain-containing protein n=1 Tax=Pontibacter ruber TaxID=1343895 RepID=A0ABW5CXE6_9BACT|nr:rhodanese-like domain-containing protein [Pontibacter ruber]
MKWIALSLLVTSLACTGPQQTETVSQRISATEYKEQHVKDKKAVLVDVRTPAEFEAGHLEGAKNADFLSGDFAKEMQNWDKNKTYYLYCASGNRSGKAAKLMEEAGFKKIYNIGGYSELKTAGLSVKE